MIAWLKGLLSSDKIVEAGIAAGDKVFYTPEEKADTLTQRLSMKLQFVQASLPMEVTRRFVAIAVTCAWVVNGGLCMFLYLLSAFGLIDATIPEKMFSFGNVYVMPPFAIIVGFYFWVEGRKLAAA